MMFAFWSKVTGILAILLVLSVSGMPIFFKKVTITQISKLFVVSGSPQFGRPRIHNLAGEYSSIGEPAATRSIQAAEVVTSSAPAVGAVQTASPPDSGSVSFSPFCHTNNLLNISELPKTNAASSSHIARGKTGIALGTAVGFVYFLLWSCRIAWGIVPHRFVLTTLFRYRAFWRRLIGHCIVIISSVDHL